MLFAKRWRKTILFLTLLVFLAVEIPIITAGMTSQPVPSDVIIVLGAKLIGHDPSTMLRLRLDEAVRLFGQGYAPAIIVSGAQGRDEAMSEASAMRDYLVSQGIPAERIITEEASFNTYQNLVNSRSIMQAEGLKKAIIVSSASHIRRSLALAKQLEMDVSGAPAPMAENFYLTTKQYLREGAAMVVFAVTGR
ncbi:MAG: YdcF family protein [Negativicutes bacterium]|nr:YdcF family protein [Negativicutes bacterium]